MKDIHIFITGVGNVGGYLIQQIKDQKDFISENLGLKLKIIEASESQIVKDMPGIVETFEMRELKALSFCL